MAVDPKLAEAAKRKLGKNLSKFKEAVNQGKPGVNNDTAAVGTAASPDVKP